MDCSMNLLSVKGRGSLRDVACRRLDVDTARLIEDIVELRRLLFMEGNAEARLSPGIWLLEEGTFDCRDGIPTVVRRMPMILRKRVNAGNETGRDGSACGMGWHQKRIQISNIGV